MEIIMLLINIVSEWYLLNVAMLSQENVTIWINDDETCFVLDQMRWGGSSLLY